LPRVFSCAELVETCAVTQQKRWWIVGLR